MSPAAKAFIASVGACLTLAAWQVAILELALKAGKAMELVDEAEMEQTLLDEEAGDRLSSDFYHHLKKRIKDIEAWVGCPSEYCNRATLDPHDKDLVYRNGVYAMVMHLNDDHRWKRERIADWLDDLAAEGLDLEVHQDPLPEPEPEPRKFSKTLTAAEKAAVGAAMDAAIYALAPMALPIPALSDPNHDKAKCPVCSAFPTITSIPKELS